MRSGSMPGVGAYFVLPAFSAAMHASLMCSGVSKSGSPAAKPQTSSPAACSALALASTASVGEGETFRAQTESGAGGLLMDKRGHERLARNEKQARPWRKKHSAPDELIPGWPDSGRQSAAGSPTHCAW